MPAPADRPPRPVRGIEIFVWCLYDWAESAYSTLAITILVSYVTGVVFAADSAAVQWLAAEEVTQRSNEVGDVVWAWGIGVSMLIAAILSPILGAMADARAKKHVWFAGNTLVGATCTTALAFIPPERSLIFLPVFLVAWLCYELGHGFYNSFLPELTNDQNVDRVSAFGFGAGYVGGGLALLVAMGVIMAGGRLGLPDADNDLRDYQTTRDGRFQVDVPPGNYLVKATGSGTTIVGAQDIRSSGLEQEGKVSATAGKIELDLMSSTGEDEPAAIYGLQITSGDGQRVDEHPAVDLKFDFGTAGSAAAEGAIWVSATDKLRDWDLKEDKKLELEPQHLRFGWEHGEIRSHDDVIPLRLRIGLAIMGLWWGLFALPAIFVLRDRSHPSAAGQPLTTAMGQAVRKVGTTLGRVRQYRILFLFLLGFLFFNDGIQTIINQASIFATNALSFTVAELSLLILMIQFLALPGAMAVGYISQKVGQKPTLITCLCIWLALCVAAYFVNEKWHLWALAVVLAMVMGGTQSVSRAVMATMTPVRYAAEFFGFFNLSGKATSWMGSLVFGGVMLATGDAKQAIVSLIVFFVIGLLLVLPLNVAAGRKQAETA